MADVDNLLLRWVVGPAVVYALKLIANTIGRALLKVFPKLTRKMKPFQQRKRLTMRTRLSKRCLR
jgi:hypothetical protein